jgi:hypothetical protein
MLLIVSGVTLTCYALTMRCQRCKKMVLAETFGQPPYSRENKIFGFAGLLGIAMNVSLKRSFTCVHCGQ